MRIKLLVDLPVDPIHEMYKDSEYDVVYKYQNSRSIKVISNTTGEEIAIMRHEYEIIEND